MKILLKISGEFLSNENGKALDYSKVQEIAGIISKFKKEHEVAVVVGGGNIVRGKDWSKKSESKSSFDIDFSGMLSTVINSLCIKQCLLDINIKSKCYSSIKMEGIGLLNSISEALSEFRKGSVVIFAGGLGEPGLSTDTTASLRAKNIGADMLIKMTKVDGIYDQDPLAFALAKKIDCISYEDYINKNLKVIDSESVSILKTSGIKIIVSKMNIKSVEKILEKNYSYCSIIK